MAIRLPIPGSDDGQWGSLLNSFLGIEHNSDGTLKKGSAITQAQNDAATALSTANAKYTKPSGGVPKTDLATAVQTSLGKADSAVQSINAKTGTSITLTSADVGAISQNTADNRYVASASVGQNSGVAPLDANGLVPSGNLPSTSNAVTSVNSKTGAVVLGESDISGLTSDLAAKYAKPGTGIPSTDLTSAVQTSLGKADSALQSAPVSSVNTQTGAVTITAASLGAQTQSTADGRYIAQSAKGAVSGVASLDSSGRLPSGQLPTGINSLQIAQNGTVAGTQPEVNFIAGSNVTIVTANDNTNSKVDVTINASSGSGGSSTLSGDTDVAITTPSNGDVLTYNTTGSIWENKVAPTAPVTSVNSKTGAVVLGESDISGLTSDLAAKYAKPGTGIPSTDLTSAVQTSLGKADSALQSAPVSSVNSKTGTVVLAASDVGLGNVNNTSDANKPVSTAAQTALNAKASTSTTISTSGSLTGGGDLSTNRTLSLSGDSATPGNSKYYGTSSGGVKGYYALPSGGSSSGYTFVSKTSNYTASNNDFILADSTSSAITITLPAPVTNGLMSVKRLNPAGNSVSVAAPSGSYIDAASGVGTATVNSQFQSQDFLSDGSNWYRV